MRLTMANQPRYYAALGDSMSIDDYAGGVGCGAASLLYRNRDDDFPDWKGRDIVSTMPGARLIPLAMDGATAAGVRYVQMPRLKGMDVIPSVVTLTMGGNDLLQTFGDDATAVQVQIEFAAHGRALLDDLRALIGPSVPLILNTIYDPSDGTGNTEKLQIMAWPSALGWISRYNETIRELARSVDAILIDLHAAFQGHGPLAGNPYQSEPRPANRDLSYCGVVEPNAWGANAIRGLWWDALAAQETSK